MEELLSALCQSEDPHVRCYVAYLLGKIGDHRAVPELIRALGDTDREVREQAALALSNIGKAAIDPLIAELQSDKWQTRYRAVEALGKIADRKVVAPLLQALRDERDHVRYMAAKGLRDIRDSDAIDPLIALLKDENEHVRRMAATGLGVIGGTKVNEALLEALKTEQNEKVKEAIREAVS
jgi:HEAT repeat protein